MTDKNNTEDDCESEDDGVIVIDPTDAPYLWMHEPPDWVNEVDIN